VGISKVIYFNAMFVAKVDESPTYIFYRYCNSKLWFQKHRVHFLYLYSTMSGSGDHDDESYVVKLRGLPWSTTVDEILKFFSKYEGLLFDCDGG
jgi:hypothetical protein